MAPAARQVERKILCFAIVFLGLMAPLLMLSIPDTAVLRSASRLWSSPLSSSAASFAPSGRQEKETELLEGVKERIKPPFLFPGLKKFTEYAETPQLTCPERKYFGGKERRVNNVNTVEGDKAVCLSSPYNITPGNCLVYSFGIARDWSFDDAMAQYGCEVYSFDPTIGLENHQRSEKVRFYNLGLGGANRTTVINGVNATLLTLGQIVDMLGHTNKTIDYLKVDID
ncbi:methyltransferase-like protein 24, partial [Penaeus japonicus]|uniref:methyltransferase-like protein 24 n=1 Tax=Penaeus japonicus TaxID=27405 RepID=UPI001C717A03